MRSKAGVLLFVLPLLISCSPNPPGDTTEARDFPVAKTSYPYVVKVHDFYGAEGYALDYYVSETSIVVVLTDIGNPPEERLNRELTEPEKAEWTAYVQTLGIDELEDVYDNPNVVDGLQQTFDFRIGGKQRQIEVFNRYVPELADLCDKINELVPEDLRMSVATPEDELSQ